MKVSVGGPVQGRAQQLQPGRWDRYQHRFPGRKTAPDEPADLIQIVLPGLVEDREMTELRVYRLVTGCSRHRGPTSLYETEWPAYFPPHRR